MTKTVNINSGQFQTIEVANKISISTICIYGGNIKDILNEIIAGNCVIKISLLDDERREFFELNLFDLIKPNEDYQNWKLCIFKMDGSILFPKIDWGKNYVDNKIQISFYSKCNKLIMGVLYEIMPCMQSDSACV